MKMNGTMLTGRKETIEAVPPANVNVNYIIAIIIIIVDFLNCKITAS